MVPPVVEVRDSCAATPEAPSVAAAVTVTEAALVHEPSAPVTVTAGGVRSIRTEPAPPAVAAVQGEVLPAWSVARNWTSVVPSRLAVTAGMDWGASQVAPPSADVRDP